MSWKDWPTPTKWGLLSCLAILGVAGIVALVILLVRHHSTTRSSLPEAPTGGVDNTVPKWNGLEHTNGDLPASTNLNRDLFTHVTDITGTIGQDGGFAYWFRVQQNGMVAVVSYDTAGAVLHLLETTVAGGLQVNQRFRLNYVTGDRNNIFDTPNQKFLPRDGAFVPFRNLNAETYYFLMSGYYDDTDTSYATLFAQNQEYYPNQVLIFACITSDNYQDPTRQRQRGTWFYTSQTLTHPFCNAACRAALNVGGHQGYSTFGDVIQCVVNKDDIAHVFIRGSEWRTSEPGGSIFWYTLQREGETPLFDYIQQIKDPLLQDLYDQNTANWATLQHRENTDLWNVKHLAGFGSTFAVDMDAGLLYVGNPTNEALLAFDENPATPYGYIQLFRLQLGQGGTLWTPTKLGNTYQDRISGGNLFQRSNPNQGFTDIGLGFSLSLVGNKLLMTAGNSNKVYLLTSASQADTVKYQYEELDLSSTLTWDRLWPCGCKEERSGAGNVDRYPCVNTLSTVSGCVPFSHQVLKVPLDNTWLVNAFSTQGNVAELAVMGNTLDTKTGQTTFSVKQVLGSGGLNSNRGLLEVPGVGFGQSLGVWLSKTQRTIYLLVSDPFYLRNQTSNDTGRMLFFAKQPGVSS